MSGWESFVLRTLGLLAGLFAVAFLGAALTAGFSPEWLISPVLGLLSYAAFGIDRQLVLRRRARRRAMARAARLQVAVGGPGRAA